MTARAENRMAFRVRGRQWRRPLFLLALAACDLASPVAAWYVAYRLRYEGIPFAPPAAEILALSSVQLSLVATALAHAFAMRQGGFYRLHATWLPLDFVFRLAFLEVFTALMYFVTASALHTNVTSRVFVAYLALVSFALSMGIKLGARIVVLLMLCFGIGVKKVALAGNVDVIRRLHQLFTGHPHWGYRVQAVLLHGSDEMRFDPGSVSTMRSGPASRLFRALADRSPDVVVVATAGQRGDEMAELVAECMARRIEVRLVPEFSELYTSKRQIDRIGNASMVCLHAQGISWTAAFFKRVVDVALAVLLLPLLGVATAACASRAKRRGAPVFTAVPRVGMQGRLFALYRFHPLLFVRSGEDAAGPVAMPAWGVALPQILNVLRGEMSFVGPGASDPERTAHFSSWEKRKLAVRPGIVGFCEVNEARDSHDPAERMGWDIGYVERQSMAFDVNVLAAGIMRMLSRRDRVTVWTN